MDQMLARPCFLEVSQIKDSETVSCEQVTYKKNG